MLGAEQLQALTATATLEQAEEALTLVSAAHGHSLDDARFSTVAGLVAAQGYTPAELRAAAEVLAVSPELRDRLRYRGTITPADFAEVITGAGAQVDGRGPLTRGAAAVAQGRLYSRDEALARWERAGRPGPFSDSRQRAYDGAMFSLVVDGDRVLYRVKP